MAPGANLISLRVIGADGTGSTSDVIRAIHWAIRNKARYNIRVINLSLGHAVEESYKDDPLCEAVERAVNAGIVVVAAAGNRGKDDAGHSIYGGIESPGNDPYVITVGALNTHGTVARSDDELTTYSSKGPTAIDGLIKPDIAAPGNKIVSAGGAGVFAGGQLPHRAHGGQRRGCVCDVERDQHVGGRGERRGGAGAGRELEADAGAGEGGAAVLGDVHACRRTARRRSRQPECGGRDACTESSNSGEITRN